jgi:hypothetical protein
VSSIWPFCHEKAFRLTPVEIGNVSYVVPGFHGLFQIATDHGAVNHTPGFTTGAGSVDAYKRSLICATGMAVVACQILSDNEFARKVKDDFGKKE